MAAPTYVNAGAGSTDASGAWSHTGPAPASIGNLLICQVLVDGTTAGTPTITSTTNIQSLSGTANQWTAAPGNPYACGNPTAAGQLLFFARATSTSAPVITGANSGGDDIYVRIYEFTNVNTGTTLSDILENGSAGTLSNGANTASVIDDTGVTTLDADRLALQLAAMNDDVDVGFFSGQSGGTWTQPVSGYLTSTGTDGGIGLNTATMSAAGTINGGTSTPGASIGWGVVGFALIGTPAAPAAYQPRYGFTDHANPGVFMQGIRRAWHRRRSGIFVPDLWTPGGAVV